MNLPQAPSTSDTVDASGGLIGTVDFYVARKHPAEGMAKHSWLQRTFWPTWFMMDDVRLNMDHVPYLLRVRCSAEHSARWPAPDLSPLR